MGNADNEQDHGDAVARAVDRVTTGAGDWQRRTAEVTPPPEAAYAVLTLVAPPANEGTVWLDQVTLQPIEEAERQARRGRGGDHSSAVALEPGDRLLYTYYVGDRSRPRLIGVELVRKGDEPVGTLPVQAPAAAPDREAQPKAKRQRAGARSKGKGERQSKAGQAL